MTTEFLKGACICARVTVSLPKEGATTAICHCASCQKQSGGAYSVAIIAPASGVTIDGPLTDFQDTTVAGELVVRRFCPNCGAPVETVSAAIESLGVRVIKGGLLDGGAPEPQMQLFCENRLAWSSALPATAEFPQMPTQ